ncbi:MAG: bifunctional (p)ppGpp synthetase/guanosine-3',5'-bis(diphosphate) 3'-pyrophosphohydrolase [Gammaproteobacteria bacterium]|nr:bifunctional (p)ppGpp synthetase/guanosine-3',5'-bis(diphosphate) 3'-pyrophosphohydrolase [Gammaproteobacteria bacterium]
MVAGASAFPQSDPQELLRDFPSHQSAVIEEALEAPQDAALGYACAVADLLHELNLDYESIAAAVLHARELESATPPENVRQRFGAAIARLLDGLRKMDAIDEYRHAATSPGKDRKREGKQLERIKNLLLAMVEDVRVVVIKLAEHLVRMRNMRALEPHVRADLARAGIDVYAPLASRLGMRRFKWELEDLALRELEADTYKQLATQLQSRRAERERFIEQVVAQLSEELADAGIDARVSGRPKHIYSIWRKMHDKQLGFDQVFDLRAVRVLVDSIGDCYSALGVVHGLWTHIPKEFDDYITNPKPNRYQSLHTAVIGPSGRTLEVQIRTHEMHAHAEFGVAAHWRYKAGGARGDADLQAKVDWLRQVLEWKEHDGGGDDLLEQLDSELLADRVYVVTPRGQIHDLPVGATPLDFAYQVHTDVGHRCRGAKVNGAMVPLTHALKSGDKVEILTTRNGVPSRDWLNPNLGFLKTTRARAKVRHWFRQQNYDEHLAQGQEIFNREQKRLGVAEPDRVRLATRFNYKRFEDLLAGIGRGDVSPGQLTSALHDELPDKPLAPLPKPRRQTRRRREGDVRISGVGNLLTQVAGCCKPVPPEPIVGFITRGRGVSIHRSDCANVLRLGGADRARVIDVDWEVSGRETYAVALELRAFDRPGLLRDVTTVVANENVNVAALTLEIEPRDQMAQVRLTVEVSDLGELSRVMDRLGHLANVVDVRRSL